MNTSTETPANLTGTMMTMHLPNTVPRNDPSALWRLQNDLLSRAESVLGQRDGSKKICQPQFTDEGPQLRNSPNMDGAWAELGRSGESDWPTVLYQMAHETVHLLDPICGVSNNLEEGVAVAFSLHVQPFYGVCISPSLPSYRDVLRLVRMLPENPLEAGKLVRQRIGALSSATPECLGELFPNVDRTILKALTDQFVRNA